MSVAMDRFEKHKDDEFDALIIRIKSGVIKSGRFSHLVKINPKLKMKGKVFFDDTGSAGKSQGK